MRHILSSIMLIIVVAAIYYATIGAGGGMEQAVKSMGGKQSEMIRSIDP